MFFFRFSGCFVPICDPSCKHLPQCISFHMEVFSGLRCVHTHTFIPLTLQCRNGHRQSPMETFTGNSVLYFPGHCNSNELVSILFRI